MGGYPVGVCVWGGEGGWVWVNVSSVRMCVLCVQGGESEVQEWFKLLVGSEETAVGFGEVGAERKRSALVQASRVGLRRVCWLCVLEVRRFTKYGLPALPGRCATLPCLPDRGDLVGRTGWRGRPNPGGWVWFI